MGKRRLDQFPREQFFMVTKSTLGRTPGRIIRYRGLDINLVE